MKQGADQTTISADTKQKITTFRSELAKEHGEYSRGVDETLKGAQDEVKRILDEISR
jgi:hypothetical protein